MDLSKIGCQEANLMEICKPGTNEPIPCGQPGAKIVFHQNDGRNVYVMCAPCADHNIRNRGGIELVEKTGDKSVEENFCGRCEMRLALPGGDYCAICDDRIDNGPVQRLLDRTKSAEQFNG